MAPDAGYDALSKKPVYMAVGCLRGKMQLEEKPGNADMRCVS
jgi:hypothetical protein